MSLDRGHHVLQVPVPALEAFVRGRHQHHDPDYVSTDPAFVHAHVTALGPFLPAVGSEDAAVVARIAAGITPFDVRWERLAVFPDGIIHLVPEPAEPFAELTARLVAAFPQCPPYDGRFTPTPHLTLDALGPGTTLDTTRALLGDLLPVTSRTERLELCWWQAGAMQVRASWPLGGHPPSVVE